MRTLRLCSIEDPAPLVELVKALLTRAYELAPGVFWSEPPCNELVRTWFSPEQGEPVLLRTFPQHAARPFLAALIQVLLPEQEEGGEGALRLASGGRSRACTVEVVNRREHFWFEIELGQLDWDRVELA